MPALSIIITTYNIEKYVEQCLESVAAQTFGDFEALVVDDGSSDSTPAQIRAFAERDPRFVPVLLEQNSPGGVATAANAGLDRAVGEWVGFLDGDDYAEPTMFESLVTAAVAQSTDLAMCQYLEVTEDGTETHQPADARRWAGLPAEPIALDVEARKTLLRFIAVPWRKLYRRSMLEENAIRFPVGDYFYEDNPFHWFSLLTAQSIALVPRVLCYHRVGRAGQTMATADSRLFKIFAHHDTIHDWLDEHDLLAAYQGELIAWVVSQAEWISRRTPAELRAELYGILRPIIAEYPPIVVSTALRKAQKGGYAQQFTAALVADDEAKFDNVLCGSPKTDNLVLLGLSHLRHSGIRSTAVLTLQTLKHLLGPTLFGRVWRRLKTRGLTSGPENRLSAADVMFGLSVLQRRLDVLEAKMDEISRMQRESAVAAKPAPRKRATSTTQSAAKPTR